MKRTAMFLRLMWRSLTVRRGRALTALGAVVVAAGVTTANLNLYLDVESKLRHEFRSYGANIVITGKDGAELPAGALQQAERALGTRGLAVPFAFAIAHTAGDSRVVVAGTDLERVRRLNPWWSVSGWPARPGEALVGARSAEVLAPTRDPFELSFQGRKLQLLPAGVLRTGSAEDSRVYLSLQDFEAWTGLAPATIEIAASGSGEEIAATLSRLAAALPQAEVRPVRQIVEAEAQVLGKTRNTFLAVSLIIVLTAAVCVFATLTSSVLDRRKDFAVMKALGASECGVNALFAAEAAALGGAGALLGFVLGAAVAAWIGQASLNAIVLPRLGLLPGVFAGSIALTLASAILPLLWLRRMQPAAMLKGE